MKLGILGTGMIAKEVLQFVNQLEIESIYILSTQKSIEKAKELAEKYNISKCFTDYNDMLASDVEVLYIALPNHLHYEFTKKALENGKHVILEKPSTSNFAQLDELITLAKNNNVYLLEAVNLYHLPAYKALKNDLDKIGKIKIVSLNYSQYSSRYNAFKQGNILPVFDYKKSGGALMDINVYNIHASLGLFGEPKNAEYFPNIEKGIDTSGILIMNYNDFQAVCIGSKDCNAQAVCSIQGELGTISFIGSSSTLTEYKITLNNGIEQTYAIKKPEHRLIYEFREFIRIINEKDDISYNNLLKNSISSAKIIESARKKAGIYFADER